VVGWEEGEDLWNPMGTSHGWSTELVLKWCCGQLEPGLMVLPLLQGSQYNSHFKLSHLRGKRGALSNMLRLQEYMGVSDHLLITNPEVSLKIIHWPLSFGEK
jgi:hypothetical protein